MKIKYLVKLFYFVLFLIGFSATISAQNSSNYGYNDEDYDGDYEYDSYNNDYYERYSEDEYRKRQNRAYKKSYSEEELYNGGYRGKRGNYDNQSGFSSGGIGGIGFETKPNSNSWFGGNSNNDAAPIKPRNIQQFDTREVGEILGVDKLGGHEIADKNFDPKDRKEIDPKKVDDVPPPPDEPDIPIDTAIPFLVLAGLLLATNQIKNALV